MADVDLTPTAEMARNAARGLELRREHGRGGTEVGVARARDISNGKGLSPETVRRMHAFFSRHAKNKAGGEDDAGYIAWMLWGGDEGRDWASRKVDAIDRKERNAMSETRKAIMERLGMAATNDRPGAKAKFAQPPFSASDLNALKRLVKQYEKLGKESAGELDRAHHHKALAIASTLHEIIDFAASGKTGRAYAQVRMSTPEFQQLLPASLVKAAYDVTKSDTYARAGSKENMAQSLQDYQRLIGEFNALDKEIGRLIDRAKEMSAKSDRILSLFPKNERDPDAAAIAASRQAMAELRKELNVMLSRFQFSRPGAKARMSKEWQTIERYLEVLDTEFGEPRGKAAAQEMMRAAAAIGGDEGLRLKAAINTMATSRDYNARQRAYNAIASMMPFSRPGAKVRAALTDACWEGYEAVGTKPQDGKTVPNCVPKATAAKPAEDDLEREDVKAGLKLMAASDPAVSDKIRTLIKEGKPQEQAVAIALDMKRRGEL